MGFWIFWEGMSKNLSRIKNNIIEEDCSSWSTNTIIIDITNFPVMPVVDITVEQIFGDGLVWSGVVMMALLGQQKR